MELQKINHGQANIAIDPADAAQLARICQLADELSDDTTEAQALAALARTYGATFTAIAVATASPGYINPEGGRGFRQEMASLGLGDLVADAGAM